MVATQCAINHGICCHFHYLGVRTHQQRRKPTLLGVYLALLSLKYDGEDGETIMSFMLYYTLIPPSMAL
jgi:hypothetical protein